MAVSRAHVLVQRAMSMAILTALSRIVSIDNPGYCQYRGACVWGCLGPQRIDELQVGQPCLSSVM